MIPNGRSKHVIEVNHRSLTLTLEVPAPTREPHAALHLLQHAPTEIPINLTAATGETITGTIHLQPHNLNLEDVKREHQDEQYDARRVRAWELLYAEKFPNPTNRVKACAEQLNLPLDHPAIRTIEVAP